MSVLHATPSECPTIQRDDGYENDTRAVWCGGADCGDDPSARRAAVREAEEEAGLRLDGGSLISISRWITPKISPKRFDTWFFLGQINVDDKVTVDGGEIRGHRWLRPVEALEAHDRGEMLLRQDEA